MDVPLSIASLFNAVPGLTNSATSAIATLNVKDDLFLTQWTASSKSFASAPSIVIKGTLVRSFLGKFLFNLMSANSLSIFSFHSKGI